MVDVRGLPMWGLLTDRLCWLWGLCLGWLTGEKADLGVCAFAAEFSGLTPALPLGAKGLTVDGEWVRLWALPLAWCLPDPAVGVPARYQHA